MNGFQFATRAWRLPKLSPLAKTTFSALPPSSLHSSMVMVVAPLLPVSLGIWPADVQDLLRDGLTGVQAVTHRKPAITKAMFRAIIFQLPLRMLFYQLALPCVQHPSHRLAQDQHVGHVEIEREDAPVPPFTTIFEPLARSLWAGSGVLAVTTKSRTGLPLQLASTTIAPAGDSIRRPRPTARYRSPDAQSLGNRADQPARRRVELRGNEVRHRVVGCCRGPRAAGEWPDGSRSSRARNRRRRSSPLPTLPGHDGRRAVRKGPLDGRAGGPP